MATQQKEIRSLPYDHRSHYETHFVKITDDTPETKRYINVVLFESCVVLHYKIGILIGIQYFSHELSCSWFVQAFSRRNPAKTIGLSEVARLELRWKGSYAVIVFRL